MFATILATAACFLATPQDDDPLANAIALLDRLDRVSIAVDERDASLGLVLERLGERLGVGMRGDWVQLDRLGIDPDDRVTLRTAEAPGSTALALLALALGDEFERPFFEAYAGQLVLTTLRGSEAMRITGAYDVRDLLNDRGLMERLEKDRPGAEPPDGAQQPSEPDADDPPPLELRNPAEIRHLPPQQPANDDELPSPSPGEQLLLLITEHVDPEAWINFGGDRARISEINGIVMVSAAPSTHRMFRGALTQLRRANPASITVEAMMIELPRAAWETIARRNDPGSRALAADLRSDPTTTVLWRLQEPVALDAPLSADASSGAAELHLSLQARKAAESGLLTIEVEASSRMQGDERSVKTTLALTADEHAGIVELPAAEPAAQVRLLMLTIQRR